VTLTGVDIINLARLEPLYYRADGCEDKSVAGVKYMLGQAVIFCCLGGVSPLWLVTSTLGVVQHAKTKKKKKRMRHPRRREVRV